MWLWGWEMGDARCCHRCILERGTESGMADELKELSVEELFARAVAGDEEDEGAWEAVMTLQLRGDAEVFEAARVRCGSSVAKERSRALDVLGQLDASRRDEDKPYRQECVALAIGGLADGDETVVHAAAWALSHLGTEAGVEALLGVRRQMTMHFSVSSSVLLR